MDYKRNSDPAYYDEYSNYANCGSFALNLQGWYDPEIYFEDIHGYIGAWMEETECEGWSD